MVRQTVCTGRADPEYLGVDNYPGLPGISGMDLGEAMGDHAAKLGIEPVRENVLSVEMQKVQEVRRLSGQRSMNTEPGQ